MKFKHIHKAIRKIVNKFLVANLAAYTEEELDELVSETTRLTIVLKCAKESVHKFKGGIA